MTTLIALHGFTQHGALLERHLAPLFKRLPSRVTTRVPDAPHPCSEAGLRRLQRLLDAETPAPHLCWWDATDDGREYRGWEVSLDRLRALVEGAGPVGVLGFSQGAIVAAVLAGLAARGEFPPLEFVVMVAGRKPRAVALQPLLDVPLSLPSLHLWGTRDPFAQNSAPLVESFAPETREVVRWDGPHVIPTYGPGADALVDFIARQTEPSQRRVV